MHEPRSLVVARNWASALSVNAIALLTYAAVMACATH